MLDVITAAAVGFGFLGAYFLARTTGERAACFVVLVLVFLVALPTYGQRFRLEREAADLAERARLEATFQNIDRLSNAIKADEARIREICAQYPGTPGC